jgi:2-enoate reductase
MVKGEDITVLSKTVPVKLEDGVVKVNQNGAEKKIPVDSVVFAGRMTSQNELYDSLKDTENVTPIGDCVEPGRIMDAVWGGFNTVREI